MPAILNPLGLELPQPIPINTYRTESHPYIGIGPRPLYTIAGVYAPGNIGAVGGLQIRYLTDIIGLILLFIRVCLIALKLCGSAHPLAANSNGNLTVYMHAYSLAYTFFRNLLYSYGYPVSSPLLAIDIGRPYMCRHLLALLYYSFYPLYKR